MGEQKREKKEVIIAKNRDFKGIWIPERLYLTREFTPNEKFILLEIYSLTDKASRECFANNKHFADFVGLKENTVQKAMLKFESAGYIIRDYKYKENTREIEKRTIKLTKKFYDNFINETDEKEESKNESHEGMEKNPWGDGKKSTTPMEKNPWGDGKKSTTPMEKNPWGDGKKSTDKYNNNKYNNELSETRLSNTDTDKSNTSFQEGKEGRGNTFSPEKGTCPLKEKDYIHKNHITEYTQEQLEKHIASRIEYYMEKDHSFSREDGDEVERLEKIILYFYDRYYKQTGKRHPIISDCGYRKIVDAYMEPPDVMHELAVYEFEYYKPMIDKYFETDFNARGKFKGKIELSLSHFMSDRIREYLFYQTDY